MAAPNVLHERLPGDHDPGATVLLEPRIGRSRAFNRPWSASTRLLAYWSVRCPAAGASSESGSGDALLRPRPLGTGRAASTATGSGKLVRLGRSGCHPSLWTSLGPFTAGAASNLSAGSGPAGLVRSGSPDPVGTLSGSGIMPVSGQLCGTAGGGTSRVSRVPAAFRRAGVGFGVILCPLGDGRSLRSADQAPGLDPNGVATFDTDQMRPGRVLPLPRGGGVLPTDTSPSVGACRFAAASPTPRWSIPSVGALNDEACGSSRMFTLSVFPSPVTPGRDGDPWAFPSGFAPRSYPRRTPRWGRAVGHWPGTTPSTSTSILLSVCPLVACRFVSHACVLPWVLAEGRAGT
jgi:hypothetical protein